MLGLRRLRAATGCCSWTPTSRSSARGWTRRWRPPGPRGRTAPLAGLWGRLEEWFADPRGRAARPARPLRVGGEERAVDYLATLALLPPRGAARRRRLRRAALLRGGLRAGAAAALGRSRAALARAARRPALERPAPELRRAGAALAQRPVLRAGAGAAHLRRTPRLRRAAAGASGSTWRRSACGGWGSSALAAALVAGRPGRARALGRGAARRARADDGAQAQPAAGLHSLLTWTLQGLGLLAGLLRPLPRAGGAAC